MLDLKCDACERRVDDLCELVTVEHHGLFAEFDFCWDCAEPVEKFLEKKGLIRMADVAEA
jgi:hypothetical protein